MMFYENSNFCPNEDEFLSATQAKELTALAIANRERKNEEEFNLWLEKNKKNIFDKIVEACGQGKDCISYQDVPADYYILLTKYLNKLGYSTQKNSTYINGKDTNYSVYVSWRY